MSCEVITSIIMVHLGLDLHWTFYIIARPMEIKKLELDTIKKLSRENKCILRQYRSRKYELLNFPLNCSRCAAMRMRTALVRAPAKMGVVRAQVQTSSLIVGLGGRLLC